MIEVISEVYMRIRGIIDEPAIMTILWVLASLIAWTTKVRLVSPQEKHFLLWLIGISGLVLYPATLGLSMWDPYRYGYDPVGLLAVYGCIALWTAVRGYWASLCMLLAATLAFAFQLKTSINYWDYLLDPMLVIYSWLALLRLGYGRAYSGRSPEVRARVR
ncbi:MAG: hypothetical protein MUC79_14475 [Thiobacillaceae bacterium]|jgi:hypothetical protein|nr:hypothetical protein [Thiobacillaceae bacterium]